jgi:choline-sulfatase
MNMKRIIYISLLLFFTGNLFAEINPATIDSLKESRPNVLILMSDEHSPYALGCYGDELIKTPNLDALSKTGMTFNSAYCQNPVCVPSRVSLLTGKMPTDAKVFGNNNKLHEDTYTMGDVFSEAGYNAEWIGKEHWNTPGNQLGFGTLNKQVSKAREERCKAERLFRKEVGRFPQDAAVSDYDKKNSKDYLTAEYAVDFLKSQKSKESPFFLAVSMVRPHFPFDVQQKYYNMYKGKIKNPEVTEEMLANLCVTSQKERENYDFESLTEEQIQKAREIYYGMISYVDELYGMVLNELDKQGLRENTIILYTSDHGELMGEKGLWYKNSFYEGSVRVPFIWSYPKTLPKNKSIDAHVMNMDIFPTLCEMCDIPVPENLSGSSLLNLMQGKEDSKERIAISENYRGDADSFMVRKGDWKYCWYENSKEQLFNLTKDSKELNNLIDNSEYADIVKELNTIAMSHYIKKTKSNKKKK